MRKVIDVSGLGNPIVDIVGYENDDFLARHSFSKGSSELVTQAEQQTLLTHLSPGRHTFSSGGSVANSIDGIGQLGGSVALSGKLGSDRYGRFFLDELKRQGVQFAQSLQMQGATATSVVIVNPQDGQRTMRTALGVAPQFAGADVDRGLVESSQWLFIEGYLLANGSSSQTAVQQALDYAAAAGVKVALTLASESIARTYQQELKDIITQAHLVIGNVEEAQALTGKSNWREAVEALRSRNVDAAVSNGPQGVLISFEGHRGGRLIHVPPFSVDHLLQTVGINTVGAGDGLAAGLLFGLSRSIDPTRATIGGCYIASQILGHEQARLQPGHDAGRTLTTLYQADRRGLRAEGWTG